MIQIEEQEAGGINNRALLRLLAYLKPYWLLALSSLLFIAISTGGELLLPIIIQKSVDENIRPLWVKADIEQREELLQFDPRLDDQIRFVGDYIFAPESEAGNWALQHTGADSRLYFLIDLSRIDVPAVKSEFSEFNRIFSETDAGLSDETYLAISQADFSSLPRDLRLLLRQSDVQGIRHKALQYFGALILVLIASFFQLYLMALAGQGVMKDLRIALYRRTMSQRMKFLQNQQVGRLVTRLTSDVESVNALFTDVLNSVLADIFMMAGVFISLYVLSPGLATYTLMILPPVVILLVVFRQKSRQAYRRVRRWVSTVNAYLSEHLSGVALVQAFAQENRVIADFRKRNMELFKANVGELYVFTIFRPAVDLLSSISIAMVLYFGGQFLLQGRVSLGVLIAFINLIQMFYKPVRDLAEKFTTIQSAIAGGERVFSLMDEDHLECVSGNASLAKADVRGDIAFEQLRFSYVEGEEVLKGISFHCPPGSTVALVGATGSGKSTIANVLSRLWEYDSGRVSIDGIDIKDIPLPQLRTIVQPIQQDVMLFPLSVRENLLLGKHIEDTVIFEVLDQVEAGDFIRTLPDGLDTQVAENLDNFSAGQLQLLSFARLLLQDPRIVIMDEATANIDTDTEQKVQHAMNRIMQNRTTLVIAHRLSTIRHADLIVVMDQGIALESGTHDELLARKGTYAKLHFSQMLQTGG